MNLSALLEWYENLTPARVPEIDRFYREDAYFRDPFNDVRGTGQISEVFHHMFTSTENPKFHIRDSQKVGDIAWVTWNFKFGLRGKKLNIRGATRLEYDENQLVVRHRDYWDSLDLLVELPWIGKALERMRNKLSSTR